MRLCEENSRGSRRANSVSVDTGISGVADSTRTLDDFDAYRHSGDIAYNAVFCARGIPGDQLTVRVE